MNRIRHIWIIVKDAYDREIKKCSNCGEIDRPGRFWPYCDPKRLTY